jgi:hypothetical protein
VRRGEESRERMHFKLQREVRDGESIDTITSGRTRKMLFPLNDTVI